MKLLAEISSKLIYKKYSPKFIVNLILITRKLTNRLIPITKSRGIRKYLSKMINNKSKIEVVFILKIGQVLKLDIKIAKD